nr:MAG TPA: hypothetical protein [Caudoviricetes sp.]
MSLNSKIKTFILIQWNCESRQWPALFLYKTPNKEAARSCPRQGTRR